jgi:hypothetical protein
MTANNSDNKPIDIELNIINENQTRKIERVWLTKGQFEVLEIVARVLNQSISEYLTKTVLSMLECELEDTVSWGLQKKLNSRKGEEEEITQ